MIKQAIKDLGLSKQSNLKALLELLKPLVRKSTFQNMNNIFHNDYKIAVVANMSAGKSTFINAMFADNILPVYSEATSDCPVYIHSDEDPANDKAIIEFYDNKEKIVLNRNDIKKELKYYAKKDSDDLDDKYKLVKKIDLYWDFHDLKNNDDSLLNFIIIDTPGPNNTDQFKDKHHNVTKEIILNEANMVLYLLDYGQLDANLEAQKNNIWDMIRQKKEVDNNFEVFFIINKIDMALEDNKKLVNADDCNSKKEFYTQLEDFWNHHEGKAIEKVQKAANKYGFKNPKIYTSSSEYQKFIRMKNISLDDTDKLDSLKKLFKSVFGDKWKNEIKDYLKIGWIEDSTRLHIKNIEQNILNTFYRDLEKVFEEIYDNEKFYKCKSKQNLFSQLSEIKVNKYAAAKIEYIEDKYFKYTSGSKSIVVDTEFLIVESKNEKITINLDSMTKISKVKYESEKLFIAIKSYDNTYSFILPNRYKKIYIALKKYIDEKSVL